MGQPLSTGAKVAIGCVLALFVGGVVATVLLGCAVWWAKGKVQSVAGEIDKASGEMQRIEELEGRMRELEREQAEHEAVLHA